MFPEGGDATCNEKEGETGLGVKGLGFGPGRIILALIVSVPPAVNVLE